jgi:hypothetical protein
MKRPQQSSGFLSRFAEDFVSKLHSATPGSIIHKLSALRGLKANLTSDSRL